MTAMITAAGPAMWAMIGVMGASAVIPPLVWLAGLMLALRKSVPGDRPDILRAYATLRLPIAKTRDGGHRNSLRDRGAAKRVANSKEVDGPG